MVILVATSLATSRMHYRRLMDWTVPIVYILRTITSPISPECRQGRPTAKTARAASQILARLLHQPAPLEGDDAQGSLVGMGGAVTNITAVMLGLTKYDPDNVQGAVIDRTEIDRQIEIYRTTPAEARRQIVGLQPKRADVILAGACIVRTVMDKLAKSSLTVSDRGLRHGILIDRFASDPDGFDGVRGPLRIWEP